MKRVRFELEERERRRIRRLIAPELSFLRGQSLACACEDIGFSPCGACEDKESIKAIDAATRAPRKAKKA